MTVPLTLLGLLEAEPAHGYTLKRAYDEHFGRGRPLRFGQVYATLARLERDGWATLVGVHAGEGPDRKTYAITPEGVTALEEWIHTPEPTNGFTPSPLFVKVVLALRSGRSPGDVLEAQQRVHLARMREITAARHEADPVERLAGDFEIAHLEADLRWIEIAGARLTELTTVSDGRPAGWDDAR